MIRLLLYSAQIILQKIFRCHQVAFLGDHPMDDAAIGAVQAFLPGKGFHDAEAGQAVLPARRVFFLADGSGLDVVMVKCFVHAGDAPGGKQRADEETAVFRTVRVREADAVVQQQVPTIQVGSEKGRKTAQIAALRAAFKRPVGDQRVALDVRSAVRQVESDVSESQVGPGRFCRFIQFLAKSRVERIVAVEKSKVLAFGGADTQVAGHTGAGIDFGGQDAEADGSGVAVNIILGSIDAPVSTVIVDQQDLQLVEGLGDDGVQAGGDGIFGLLDGNDDRYLRHGSRGCA